MTQSEFTKLVTEDVNKKHEGESKKNLTQENVKDVINSFVSVTTEQVAKGEKISISGLGSFESVERAARNGRNPITGETIHIEAKKAPKFKAAKAFKDLVK
jgi:DNA-binding protein HU-beta